MIPIILGSSSRARQILLNRFQIPFDVISPNIDETLQPNEAAPEAVLRLAIEKAKAVASTQQHGLIIACDQLLTVNHTILGKPLTHENAVNQLTRCSGQTIQSYTGLVTLNVRSNNIQSTMIPYEVKFKNLSNTTIENYLLKDQPYHCAGSIKAESLGPTLFEWMRGSDPSALIGLPLIALHDMLLNENLDILKISK